MENYRRTDYSISALNELLKKISDKYYYFSKEERIELMKYLADSSGMKEALASLSDQRAEFDPFRLIDEKASEVYEIALQKIIDKCDMILADFPSHIDFEGFMESLKLLWSIAPVLLIAWRISETGGLTSLGLEWYSCFRFNAPY